MCLYQVPDAAKSPFAEFLRPEKGPVEVTGVAEGSCMRTTGKHVLLTCPGPTVLVSVQATKGYGLARRGGQQYASSTELFS